MTAMPVMPNEFRDWTVDDLDLLPDDGLQYELLDGMLLVSPSPTIPHQRASARLFLLLTRRLPARYGGLFRPAGLAARPAHLAATRPAGRPGRRRRDQEHHPPADAGRRDPLPVHPTKRPVPETLEVPGRRRASYWIVDPAAPSITALELVDGQLRHGRRGHRRPGRHPREAFPRDDCPGRLVQPSSLTAWSSARRR